MAYVLGAFIVSLVVTLLLVRYRRLHVKLTGDTDLEGVQKFHTRSVPRVGGLSLILAMVVPCVIAAFRDPEIVGGLTLLILASLPVFLGGLTEDITKSPCPRAPHPRSLQWRTRLLLGWRRRHASQHHRSRLVDAVHHRLISDFHLRDGGRGERHQHY